MVNQIGSDSYCPKCGKRLVSQASYCANCGTRVFRNAQGQDTSDPYLGQVIENTFEVQSILGTGSMGIVYKAYNRAFNNFVALKVLRHDHLSDRVLMTRFQREAQAASSLEHPNIIRIFHFGRTHLNAPYIAMECLNGTELAVLIPKEFPLKQERVCSFMLQAARALGAAHQANIIHRDLKPANIVVVNENQQEIVKVLDFGIAKIADVEGEGLTKEGDICGTPAFMSPEQIIGRAVTPASDLFSLGSIMYYMLTCKLPFSGTSMADMAASIMTQDPTPPSKARIDTQVHPRLDAICMKALEKDVEKRYRSASELIADLEDAMLVMNDPSSFVKPKIVVGDVEQGEDLSGETCCEISAYQDDEVEEDGTLVEMPAMLDDSEVMRTAKSGVASTVGSAVEYAISQVLSLKQDTQISAGEKTIVHAPRVDDLGELSDVELIEHRKKLFLGAICLFIGCCIVIVLICVIFSLFSHDEEVQEVSPEQQAVEVPAKPVPEPEPELNYAEILQHVDVIYPQMKHGLMTGGLMGVVYIDGIGTVLNTLVLDDTEDVGEEAETAETAETAEPVEPAETGDAEAAVEEPEPKPEPTVVKKPTTPKKAVSKKTSSKSSSKSSTAKPSSKTARKSASATSDAALSKLKAAQKAESSGDKVKACAIYKALHEGKEPLSQADRVKIMSKVRGCSRITI